MNIKSLLLGSAAALAAVSGAQAADAIVAAEPEPMEYVRVCDAFGTGYFYIPGTETCLKVGGYVRFQVNAQSDSGLAAFDNSGYSTNTRGRLNIDAKSDTEFGALSSRVALQANSNGGDRGSDFYLEETYLELGGFRVGYFYNYFDTGLPGETVLTDGRGVGYGSRSAQTLNNSVRYTFDGGAFSAYGQVDFFEASEGMKTGVAGADADDIGVNGVVTGKFGGVTVDFFAGYDFNTEEAAIASTLSAEIGPGKLGVFAAYAFGDNRYYSAAEWTVGAEYAIAVSEKLKLTPGAQYWDNINATFDGGDAWRVGLTADYAIATNLAAKATVNYTDIDTGAADGDQWTGFLRLQRSF